MRAMNRTLHDGAPVDLPELLVIQLFSEFLDRFPDQGLSFLGNDRGVFVFSLEVDHLIHGDQAHPVTVLNAEILQAAGSLLSGETGHEAMKHFRGNSRTGLQIPL